MHKLLFNYWVKPLDLSTGRIAKEIERNRTKRLTTIAFMAALAAIFQSAGGWMPGAGYLLSMLATAPIVLSASLSVRSGVTAYLLTVALLLFIQPSELLVFPFTTGLLGFGIGIGLAAFNNRIQVILFSSLLLAFGIALVIYVLHFPILGPSVVSTFQFKMTGYLILFAVIYSVIWTEMSARLLSKLFAVLD